MRKPLFGIDWLPLAAAAGWDHRASAVGLELLRRYDEPGRAYHNLTHLGECLDATTWPSVTCEDHIAVRAALWFHDAVYDATRSDNEAASADLAADRLAALGESPGRIARVRELIVDTAHRAEPATPDGRLVVDIDLSILGKNPERFDNYDAAIRQEYAHVPDEAFRRGRAAVLRGFLARPAIYRTPPFTWWLEKPARANLARSIARLEGEA